jgi:hypothetical protein
VSRITRARWRQILAQAREGATVEVDDPWVARRVDRRPPDVMAVVTGSGQHGAAWQMDLASRLQDDLFDAAVDLLDAATDDTAAPMFPLRVTWVIRAALGTPAPSIAAARLSAATWPALRDHQQHRLDDGVARWMPCVAVADDAGRPEVLIDTGSRLPRLITWGPDWGQVFVAPMDGVERLAAIWAQARLEDPEADPIGVLAVHALEHLARAEDADRLVAGGNHGKKAG